MKTIYAIGDIHGEYDLLIQLIQKINPQKDDQFIFLGDYIDRGKKSRQVIEFLLQFKNEFNCVFLKGNHEQMYLDSKKDSISFGLWKKNGGTKTIKSYKGNRNLSTSHYPFFNSLKLYYETEDYFFVHAGIDPLSKFEKMTEETFLWIREDFVFHKTNFHKKVIYGHTPIDIMKSPYNDKIGIDTGAGKGGWLTAIKLPEEKLINTKN